MEITYNRNELIGLRRKLHQHPELSGNEYQTARIIREALEDAAPDRIIEKLGGAGIAAVFEGSRPGPTLLFRCDLDALPIDEVNTFDYKSEHPGVAHKCGHDGHMTIITGLAMAVSANRPDKGKVVLLYQPSEENGQGAVRVLEDEKFDAIRPDYVFALHNLPGFPAGAVVLRKGTFAAASKGMINRLYGKTAHAGEPENGLTPAPAMAGIIQQLSTLPQNDSFEDFTLTTIIHARLGEVAFGTTPGYAEVMATLRTYSNADMDKLTRQSVEVVEGMAHSYGLKSETSWTEEFPATVNDSKAVDLIEQVARENQLQVIPIDEPLRWSEDFSNFTLKYPGALFGLGSGEQTPQLHNPDYDFPEEIIDRGIEVFYGIYLHHFK
jgi:amidohydrolase